MKGERARVEGASVCPVNSFLNLHYLSVTRIYKNNCKI